MPQPRADLDRLPRSVHVIGCGALVRELRAVLPHVDDLSVTHLPAPLHNRPDRIVPAIREALDLHPSARHVFIAYGDCGTGGALDAAIDRWRDRGLSVQRLPGDHCYDFFTGEAAFAALHEQELGTFFLTDYLARHFDLLVWQGLGLDDHPELLPMYFGNYQRLVFLSQSTDSAVVAHLDSLARSAADRLGLRFEHHPTGLAPFQRAVEVALASSPTVPPLTGPPLTVPAPTIGAR